MVPGASLKRAKAALEEFLATGRLRPTPRSWTTRLLRDPEGLIFIYNAARPDVVALVQGGVVVTVLSRALRPRPAEHRPVQARRRRARLVPAEPFRWNGTVEVEA